MLFFLCLALALRPIPAQPVAVAAFALLTRQTTAMAAPFLLFVALWQVEAGAGTRSH